ncbi:MAG: helix-turn-helix transcriptional regulator [Oscillospiraceae bacterium]|nr:helix-turn-helix transcriptional regulator [Oscillospiraceae bacterium]
MSLIHIFATNLRKYRTEQNMSQEYLAELAGLHRTYISAVEREQRNISIENIQRISDALKIEPYRLFIEESD